MPPPPPDRLVSRPRLMAALDRAAAGPATLLSAPPGYGKTVLLGSWVAAGSPPGPVAWLSLDPCDNDPHRFWTHLVTALSRTGALPPGSELDGGLAVDEPGDWLLPVLLEDLQRSAAPLVLVLDDVHELADARVRGVVDVLLRHAGPKLRLVLAARWDPVLSLHRLALDGRLTQLRATDLAFTPGEVLELMARYGLSGRVSHRDVELLHMRTEGWAAALGLAAASMLRERDLHHFIAQLAGDDRSVSGYLFSEVLARQPAELRRFMLRTCMVDELDPELADALTGTGDGVRALAELERTGLVSSVGPATDAYRYHPLFAELLRHELRRQEPQTVHGLRRRAAVWYRDHGSPVRAVLQGVALEDWGFVADVVTESGFTQMFRGDDAAARTLLDEVPSKAFHADPALALLDAAERLLSGEDWEGAALRLALEQERSVPADRRPRLGLVLGACWAVSATREGDLEGVRRAGRHLLAAHRQLGPDVGSGVVRDAQAVGLPRIAAAALWRGELDAAEAHLRLGHAAALGARLLDEQVACLGLLALSQALRGRLNKALSTAEAALATAARGDHRAGHSAAAARLAQAQVHYARDEVLSAEARLQQVAEVSLPRVDGLRVLQSILEGRCRLARHDPAGALRALAAARRDLVRSEDTVMLCRRLALAEVDTHVALGNLTAARVALARLQPIGAPTGAALLASERLRLAESGPAGARTSVSRLQEAAPSPEGNVSEEIRRALLVALALDLDDREEQVPAMLQRAVGLAEPEDHRRLFLDSGGVGRRLLARYRNAVDASWPFLDEVTADPSPLAVSPAPAHVETLSQREQDVLRYLPTMLTFAEIGSELFISVNTTKSHVRSIYRKLGVDGRREAVRRARQLQLLRP